MPCVLKISMSQWKVKSYVLASLLQLQLQQLMDILNSTEPHYIRCIKPNSDLRPEIFENVSVLQQLRSGVSILGIASQYHNYLFVNLCAF